MAQQQRGEVVILRPVKLACSACGAEAAAACGCNAPYVPAGARAAAAVAVNPEKSDRAIAAEIGVDHKTVGAARQTGENSPVEKGAGHDETTARSTKRVGRDGRKRRLPKSTLVEPRRRPGEPPRDDRPDEVRAFEEGPIAWRNRATSAANMANYAPFETCPTNREMLKLIEQVIANWTALSARLKGKINGKNKA